MDIADQLEKLAYLIEKGVLSQSEFETQKRILLSKQQPIPDNQKSGIAFLILAFLLGSVGVHNFYAGYWMRGVAQALLTIFGILLGLPIAGFVFVWVIVEMIVIRKDATGKPMTSGSGCLIVLLLIILLPVIGVLAIGGVVGYTLATNRYRANEIIDYVAKCSIAAMKNEQGEFLSQTDCTDLVGNPPVPLQSAIVYRDNGSVKVSVSYNHNSDNVQKAVKDKTDKVSPDGTTFQF